MVQYKQAFTLIELLVVVLIIGILAAVALPQYEFAVAKARVSTMLPKVNAIVKASETYYLVNGFYSYLLEDLDIDVANECTKLEVDGDYTYVAPKYQCGKYFMLDFDSNRQVTVLHYCPGYNQLLSTCTAHGDFLLRFGYLSGRYANKQTCVVRNNSTLGTKICNSGVFIVE